MNIEAIEAAVEEKLISAFSPSQLDVVSQVDMYSNEYEEPMLKVVIISKAFEGKRVRSRHNAINKVLAEELMCKLSGLALHTYTESEWNNFYAEASLTSV